MVSWDVVCVLVRIIMMTFSPGPGGKDGPELLLLRRETRKTKKIRVFIDFPRYVAGRNENNTRCLVLLP